MILASIALSLTAQGFIDEHLDGHTPTTPFQQAVYARPVGEDCTTYAIGMMIGDDEVTDIVVPIFNSCWDYVHEVSTGCRLYSCTWKPSGSCTISVQLNGLTYFEVGVECGEYAAMTICSYPATVEICVQDDDAPRAVIGDDCFTYSVGGIDPDGDTIAGISAISPYQSCWTYVPGCYPGWMCYDCGPGIGDCTLEYETTAGEYKEVNYECGSGVTARRSLDGQNVQICVPLP